jgi:toxin ParE1/3/4
MAKLILRKEAVNDLTDIWNYSSNEWSEIQADKYYSLIYSAFRDITKNSAIGKSYHEIYSGLHGYKVGKHIIFYLKAVNGDIDVLRILHERMDLKYKLSD